MRVVPVAPILAVVKPRELATWDTADRWQVQFD
jgi:hypothetical protein